VRAFSGSFVIKGKSDWRFREDKPSDLYHLSLRIDRILVMG